MALKKKTSLGIVWEYVLGLKEKLFLLEDNMKNINKKQKEEFKEKEKCLIASEKIKLDLCSHCLGLQAWV